MTKHINGMYYQIITPGSDSRPKSSSTIYVKYVGKKLDDTIFDQATNPGQTGFYLTQLIEAWQAGLPLIGKGGRILLTVPSSLGYSCQGSGNTIPPNTPLFFDITLVEFN
jgi:FKBP-type peptidyl-prolyl cis-trans isomerase